MSSAFASTRCSSRRSSRKSSRRATRTRSTCGTDGAPYCSACACEEHFAYWQIIKAKEQTEAAEKREIADNDVKVQGFFDFSKKMLDKLQNGLGFSEKSKKGPHTDAELLLFQLIETNLPKDNENRPDIKVAVHGLLNAIIDGDLGSGPRTMLEGIEDMLEIPE